MGRKMNYVIGTSVAVATSLIGVSTYVSHKLLHPKRKLVGVTPSDYNMIYQTLKVPVKHKNKDIQLIGWWIPAKTKIIKGTIIFTHGYGSTRVSKTSGGLELASFFVEEGYNVVMYDLRGMGESDGKATTMGIKEKEDLIQLIAYLKQEKSTEKMILMGWSLGAVVSIMAGCESKDIDVIIADSPFSDLKNYMKSNLPVWSRLPRFPFTHMIMGITPVLFRMDSKLISPIKYVEQLDETKLFLIHAKNDAAIPYRETQKIYNKIKDKSNIKVWYPYEGNHVQSYMFAKEKYKDEVLSFIES